MIFMINHSCCCRIALLKSVKCSTMKGGVEYTEIKQHSRLIWVPEGSSMSIMESYQAITTASNVTQIVICHVTSIGSTRRLLKTHLLMF